MTDNDAHGSADDKLTSELLRNYRAGRAATVESSEKDGSQVPVALRPSPVADTDGNREGRIEGS